MLVTVYALVLTSPKSLDRVLEFLFYLWRRNSRWVFLGAKCLKHLPADVLELTPLRFRCKNRSKTSTKLNLKLAEKIGLGLAQNHLQADVLVLTPKLNPTSLTPFRF